MTILLSAFGAVFGMLMFNKLPTLYNPLFRSERFRRAYLRNHDGDFELPSHVMALYEEMDVYVAVRGSAFVAIARTNFSTKPPIHIFQDMDNQPRFQAQSTATFWADDRAMRKPVPGTVARGQLNESDPLYRGLNAKPGVSYEYDRTSGLWTIDGEKQTDMANVPYVDGYPDGITVDEAFIRRGAVKFATYCAPCHGYNGDGDGMIHQSALRLAGPRHALVQNGIVAVKFPFRGFRNRIEAELPAILELLE